MRLFNKYISATILNIKMKQKIKILNNIHLSICAAMIIVYVMIGNISIDKLMINRINIDDSVYLAIPVLAFFLSNFLFKSQLKQADPKLKPEENLPIYQTASIIRWAILEGAAFVILFLKPDFILLGILLIVYLILLRPTEERIINDFENIK